MKGNPKMTTPTNRETTILELTSAVSKTACEFETATENEREASKAHDTARFARTVAADALAKAKTALDERIERLSPTLRSNPVAQ